MADINNFTDTVYNTSLYLTDRLDTYWLVQQYNNYYNLAVYFILLMKMYKSLVQNLKKEAALSQ